MVVLALLIVAAVVWAPIWSLLLQVWYSIEPGRPPCPHCHQTPAPVWRARRCPHCGGSL